MGRFTRSYERSASLLIRCAPEQLDKLRAAAADRGQSVTDFVLGESLRAAARDQLARELEQETTPESRVRNT